MSLILNSILLIILINICIIFEEFTQHILSVLLLQKNIYFVIYMIKLGIEFNYEIYTYIYVRNACHLQDSDDNNHDNKQFRDATTDPSISKFADSLLS